MRIATDPRVLALASGYLGLPATVVEVSAWRSMPGADKAVGAQIFHRDRDDFRACKLFFYLSDVGTDDGPHIFVRSSHDFESVCSRFPNISAAEVRQFFFRTNGRDLKKGAIETLLATGSPEPPAGTGFSKSPMGGTAGKVPTGGERSFFRCLRGHALRPAREENAFSRARSLSGGCERLHRDATRSAVSAAAVISS